MFAACRVQRSSSRFDELSLWQPRVHLEVPEIETVQYGPALKPDSDTTLDCDTQPGGHWERRIAVRLRRITR